MNPLLFVLREQVKAQRLAQPVLVFVRFALVERMDVSQHLRKPLHVGFLQNHGNNGDFPLQRAGDFLLHDIAVRLKGQRRDQQHKDIHAVECRVDLGVVILARRQVAVEPHGAVVRVEDVPHHVVAVDDILLAVAQEHHAPVGGIGHVPFPCAVGKLCCRHFYVPPVLFF